MIRRKSLGITGTLMLTGALLLAACSNSGNGNGNSGAAGGNDGGGNAAQNGDAAGGASATGEAAAYPLKTDKTLSYWIDMNPNIVGLESSLADVPFYQEWQKKTGVKLDFISPVAGQAKESLNVMLSSGKLPDMIEYGWLFNFPGGPEKAIKDGYILKLNDLIDKYAPNYKKFLSEHPDIDKMAKTDSGSYYAFPFIQGEDALQVYQGPVVRKDWLDELGLPMPTTIDEWHTVLTAFKEKKGAAAPLSFIGTPRPLEQLYNGAFIGAFGISRTFYVEDGVVKFGPTEPGYKDFLATFSQWYKEGLLDKNIAAVDGKAIDANVISGATGATVGNTGSGIGRWMPLLKEKDPKGDLVGAPYPVLNKGDRPKFGQKAFPYNPDSLVAVTSATKDPELAVRFLDYGYSDEGKMFFNFGTEGESYEMKDGYPTFTDLVMKNPDNLTIAQAMSQYSRGNGNGPFVQDTRNFEQYLTLQEQKDAVSVWSDTDASTYNLPPITATPEESSELANIMNDVNTLVDEMTLKIILGTEPVDSYDSYKKKLDSLNLKRAIEIQQAALDRYNKR